MLDNCLFSSDRTDWATPRPLFDRLDAEFRFDVDVCALPDNAKCATYFTPADDGLAQDWAPFTCWLNPPYGREIARWMQKAYTESLLGATVVVLVPARTDTRWWHDWAMKAHEVEFVLGRVTFVAAEHPAPFPSVLVVYRPGGRPDGLPVLRRSQS